MRKDQGTPTLRTPGVVARELGEPLHRVQYILQTRAFITPSARAGRLRLYDRQAVAMIRHALNAMDARKGGRLKQKEDRMRGAAMLFEFGQWGTRVGAVLGFIDGIVKVCASHPYGPSILVLLLLGIPTSYFLRRHYKKNAHEYLVKVDSVLESLGLRDDELSNMFGNSGDVTIVDATNDDENESET